MSHSSHSDLEKSEFEPRPTASSVIPQVATSKDLESAPEYHVATLEGVHKVEAVNRVWGPKLKIALWVGVAITAYIYSLDGTTIWQYAAFATSDYALHSLLGAIGTAQAIVLAVSKPVAAKVADVFGRAEALTLLVFFYVLGYAIVAGSNNIHTYAAGAIIYQAGYASLQIMLQIIIGDMTSLRWRSLVSSCVSLPFFINAFVASNIGAAVNAGGGWRWGYGMFCIIIPAGLSPVIGTLYYAQYKARKAGVVATNYSDAPDARAAEKDTRPIARRVVDHLISLDAFGLLLFAAGWSCLLLPLTLVNRATLTWNSGKIIAMLTVGPIILIAFVVYEARYAPKPLFPVRLLSNKTVVACAAIGLFDFISFYLQYTYLYSFINVTRGWSLVDQNYFAYTQTLCLTFFAILAGAIQAWTRRGKWLLVGGLCIRLLGVGLMIKSRGAHGSTFLIVMTQVLQGMGGGIAATTAQLFAQASVTHQDLATVTAFILLLAEIGNAVGTAIASAVWKNNMPGELARNLAGILNTTEIASVFGSITTAASYRGVNDAAYEGIITSYDSVMKTLLIAATCIAIVPIALAIILPDIYLGDGQNAVEKEDLGGRPITARPALEEKA